MGTPVTAPCLVCPHAVGGKFRRTSPRTPPPGAIWKFAVRWKPGDEVTLQFDFALRAVAGANEAAGKVSLYRGPLLLAWDQAHTPYDEQKIPAVDLARLAEARLVPTRLRRIPVPPRTWLQVDLPAKNGDHPAPGGLCQRRDRPHALSLLAPGLARPLPPPVFTQYPRDAEHVRRGPVQFQWRARHRILLFLSDKVFGQRSPCFLCFKYSISSQKKCRKPSPKPSGIDMPFPP